MAAVSRLASILIITAVAMSAQAQDRSADIRVFVSHRFDTMVRGDLAALSDCLADDLTYTHTTGQSETKAQFLETLRTGRLKYEQIEPVDLHIRFYGETAVVTGRSTMHIQSQGRPQVFQIRFVEVDVRQSGRWQVVAWQATRLP